MLVMGVLNNYLIPGDITSIKPYNNVMISDPKNVITIPSYVDIISGIFPKSTFKIWLCRYMSLKIKDELVLHGMTRAAAY